MSADIGQILLGTAVFTALVMALSVIVLAARHLIWGQGQAKINVNDDLVFDSPLGGKLLETLTNGGIHLPTSCGGTGTCGLCNVRVLGADDDALPMEYAALGSRQIKDGQRLACQLVVRGDMTITVPPELLGIETWACPVLSTQMLSPLIKEIVLGFPEGSACELPAGSYVVVNAPVFELAFSDMEIGAAHESGWQRMGLRDLVAKSPTAQSRAYSLVLRPDDPARMTLNIRLALPPPNNPDAPPGQVSSYLFGSKAGDSVNVTGPFGHFFVRESQNEMIFIGVGVGMAPLYTHIYDQLQRLGTKRTMSYWYGARSRVDLYYADEMEALAEAHDHFTWCPVLSEPLDHDQWTADTGYVHEVVFKKHLENHPAPERCEYYLCGPPVMIQAVHAMLDGLGVPKDNIFSDDFGE